MKNKNVIKVNPELFDVKEKLFHKRSYEFYKTQLTSESASDVYKAKLTLEGHLGRRLSKSEISKLIKTAKAEQIAREMSSKIVALGFEDDTGILKSDIVHTLATAQMKRTITTQTLRFKKIKLSTLSREIKQGSMGAHELMVSAKNEMVAKWISALRNSSVGNEFTDAQYATLIDKMNSMSSRELYDALKRNSMSCAHLLFESDPNEIALDAQSTFGGIHSFNYILRTILGGEDPATYYDEM